MVESGGKVSAQAVAVSAPGAAERRVCRTARSDPMYFGNTTRDLKGAAIVFATIGALVFAALVFAGRDNPDAPWGAAVACSLAIAVGPTLLVAPFSLFAIRIHGDQIAHVLARRWVLSGYPLLDLESVRLGGVLFGVTLRFRSGARIRFLGANLAELRRMCEVLRERCPRAHLEAHGRLRHLLSGLGETRGA